jgi:hypothetical protein
MVPPVVKFPRIDTISTSQVAIVRYFKEQAADIREGPKNLIFRNHLNQISFLVIEVLRKFVKEVTVVFREMIRVNKIHIREKAVFALLPISQYFVKTSVIRLQPNYTLLK